MKQAKIMLASALLLGSLRAQSQLLIQFVGDTARFYRYRVGDEFNGPGLDDRQWSVGLGWTRVLMSQDLAFLPGSVRQDNGMVAFKADKKDSLYALHPWEIDSALLKRKKMRLDGNRFNTKYSAGCMISRAKYHYGFYEIRFKVEQGRGVWPAFWFFGGRENEEIDVFELKGEKNDQIHVDTHCPQGCDKGYKNRLGLSANWGDWMKVSRYLHEGFNIMQLDWRPGSLVWYINGYPLAYFKGDFPNPMNLYLNTSVAKDGEAFKPGPDESTTWPNYYYVDYFRAWQLLPAGASPLLERKMAFSASDVFPSDYDNKPLKKSGLMYRKKELDPLGGFISLSVSSDRKLSVLVLGKLRETVSGLIVRTSGGEYAVSLTGPPDAIQLAPGEKQIELSGLRGKKPFRIAVPLAP